MLRSVRLTILLLVAISCVANVMGEEPTPGKQVEQYFEYSANPRYSMGYLLYLPADYGKSDGSFPMIVFLHGGGERGNNLSKLKVHGPPMLAEQRSDFPFIVVSPQLSLDNPRFDSKSLAALLDSVEQRVRVDKDRVYLTGLSMGGGGTWQLAAHQPDRFAAIVPICGYTDTRDAVRLKKMSVWVVHGDADTAVPFPESEQMVDALRDAGANVKFTIFHGGPHDTWTTTYGMPEFYEWLLRQRRSGK